MNIVDFIKDINAEMFSSKTNGKEEKIANDITELQMHKILFFVFGSFYNKYKQELWDCKFEAWQYGPVELNYRKKQQLESCIDIDSLNTDKKKYLKDLIQRLIKTSVWYLVDFSHSLDCWCNNHKVSNSTIAKQEIIEDFENIRI